MGSLISQRSMLKALPDAEVSPLDLVAVMLDDVSGPWARFVNSISGEGYAGLVKIFLGRYEAEGENILLFGQLNPPTMVPIPETAIASLSKLDFCKECSGVDRDALELLIPFVGLGLQSKEGLS